MLREEGKADRISPGGLCTGTTPAREGRLIERRTRMRTSYTGTRPRKSLKTVVAGSQKEERGRVGQCTTGKRRTIIEAGGAERKSREGGGGKEILGYCYPVATVLKSSFVEGRKVQLEGIV